MKARYNGFEFRNGVTAAIHKICADQGIDSVQIVWSGDVSTACINADGALYLPNPRDGAVLTHAMLERFVGYGFHELLHRKYTDFAVSGGDQYLDMIHNAVEDAWIERNAVNARLTGNADALLKTLIDGLVAEGMEHVTDWADPAQYPFSLAVFCRPWATPVPVPATLLPIWQAANALIPNCRNSYDTLEVAKYVFDNLPRTSAKNRPNGNQAPKLPQPQAGDAGDKQPAGQGAGDAQGDQQGDESNKTAPNAGKAQQVSSKTIANDAEPNCKLPADQASGGTYSGAADLRRKGFHLSQQVYPVQMTASAKLRVELKRLLDASAREEFTHGLRTGRLNVQSLPKHSYSDTIFSKRMEQDGIDTAVGILIDVSNSMLDACAGADGKPDSSTLLREAVNAAATLLDCLRRAQVPTLVATFDDFYSVVKDWNESPIAGAASLSRVKDGGSTEDFASLRWMHDQLQVRSEQRKIVFVLTDGCGDFQSTYEQTLSGERLGITTIAIGLNTDVSHAYNKSVRVANAAQLGEVSFKQIKLAL
jgi:nicotinamidase-related amidase